MDYALTKVNLNKQKVVIRCDLNAPVAKDRVTSDARLVASRDTIRYLLDNGATVTILAHRGRPKEGVYDAENSLTVIKNRLEQIIDHPIVLQPYDNFDATILESNRVVMLENVRFNIGEKQDSSELAQKYAKFGTIFVMDAFGCAHRNQASITAITQYMPTVVPGFLLEQELAAINSIMKNPQQPITTIVGGSKVSSKLGVLQSLSANTDYLIVGGGIANTFLKAAGYEVGQSLFEPDLVETAKQLLQSGVIQLPVDVVVANELSPKALAKVKAVADVTADDKIFDIGPKSAQNYADLIAKSRTVMVNGPVGVFEIEQFAKGTEALLQAIALSPAYSVAGGGDTIAAAQKFGLLEQLSYVSTGGGAFLEMLENKPLPGLRFLQGK